MSYDSRCELAQSAVNRSVTVASPTLSASFGRDVSSAGPTSVTLIPGANDGFTIARQPSVRSESERSFATPTCVLKSNAGVAADVTARSDAAGSGREAQAARTTKPIATTDL